MKQPKPIPESEDLAVLLNQLEQVRVESTKTLSQLPVDMLDTQTQINGKDLRQMCHMWIDHYLNHAVQISDRRIELNDRSNEMTRLIAESYATYGRVLAGLLTLHSKELDYSPDGSEWSILEIAQHLLEFERRYAAEFKRLANQKCNEDKDAAK